MRRVIESHEDEVRQVRGVLDRTVEVKMEYEDVIKELLSIEDVKDMVIEICMRNR